MQAQNAEKARGRVYRCDVFGQVVDARARDISRLERAGAVEADDEVSICRAAGCWRRGGRVDERGRGWRGGAAGARGGVGGVYEGVPRGGVAAAEMMGCVVEDEPVVERRYAEGARGWGRHGRKGGLGKGRARRRGAAHVGRAGEGGYR